MLLELPKKLIYAGGDLKLPSENPYLFLTAIKDGAMLYSDAGRLVGQVMTDKKGATVSVADSCSYRITVANGSAEIAPLPSDTGSVPPKFEIFGSVSKYQYELFEYRKGTVHPFSAAKVTASPLTDAGYKALLGEDCNVFRSLLIVMAITMLNEGENLRNKTRRV